MGATLNRDVVHTRTGCDRELENLDESSRRPPQGDDEVIGCPIGLALRNSRQCRVVLRRGIAVVFVVVGRGLLKFAGTPQNLEPRFSTQSVDQIRTEFHVNSATERRLIA